MKERPILFSAPMVRAILDGRKTQTRRVVKPQPVLEGIFWTLGGAAWSDRITRVPVVPGHSLAARCPYGRVGDRLWVREAWRSTGDDGRADDMPPRDLQPHSVLWYQADGAAPADECAGKLRPSIFMPRWASRITLEVTGVRVERLQECSEEDAIAEGVQPTNDGAYHVEDDSFRAPDPVECYARLWEAINGDGSWDENPWVWIVEFRRIGP